MFCAKNGFQNSVNHRRTSLKFSPVNRKVRKKSIKGPVQNTNLMMSFKSIEAGHADGYALDVLSALLAGGTSSRLHKKIVYEARKATVVYAHNESQIDPGVFEIYSSLQPKTSADQVLPMIRNAIHLLQTTKVKEKELKKVKTQFMKEIGRASCRERVYGLV